VYFKEELNDVAFKKAMFISPDGYQI